MALKKESKEMFKVSNPEEAIPEEAIAVTTTGRKKSPWKWIMTKVRNT